MGGQRVVIPYTPRYRDVHQTIEQTRFVVLVAHRRFGKTVLSVNALIKAALTCRKRLGRFAYIAPYRNQAKAVAWEYLKHYTDVIPGREVNESELSISVPSPAGPAVVRLFGADNPDALRGMYFDYVVLDEVADMRPQVWGEIVRPALADRKGGALFIGTPKGINLFSDLFNAACAAQAEGGKDWAALSYPVTKTSALDPDEVERMRAEMLPNEWEQEMMCSFQASSDDVLIPLSMINDAMNRTYPPHAYSMSPLIFGVDVSWSESGDRCVIFPRRGVVALPPIVMRGVLPLAFADRLAQEIRDQKPDAVFIDAAGAGVPVWEHLTKNLNVQASRINFGQTPMRPDQYANKRAEMYMQVRQWLEDGGALPPDEGLKAELSAPAYAYNSRGLLQLEAKDNIKERLRRSPDVADALALTFAAPVAAKIAFVPTQARTDYDVLGWGA